MKKCIAVLLALAMSLSLAACGGGHGPLYEMMEQKNYQGAIAYIAELAAKERQEAQGIPESCLPLLFTTWYLGNNNDPADYEQVSFEENGKCKIGDQELSWTLNDEDEDSASVNVFKDGEDAYYVNMSLQKKTGIPTLNVSGRGTVDYGANYVNHPFLNTVFGASWHKLDRTDKPPVDSFTIYNNSLRIGEPEYQYRVTSIEENAAVLTVFGNSVDDPAYELKIGERDGYMVLTMTDHATKASYPYYKNVYSADGTLSYDETWPEIAYWRAMELLEDASDGYGSYVSWLSKSMEHQEVLVYAKELLETCKGYKDTDQQLAKFTIVKDKLLEVATVAVDHMGNERTGTDGIYEYNKKGQMIYSYDKETAERYYGIEKSPSSIALNYEYDEKGVISRITEGSGSSVYAVLTPSYDAAGNMTSVHIKTNNGEWTNYFTYDAAGKLIKADYSVYQKPTEINRTTTYTYDAAGNLVSAICEDADKYGYVYGYEYSYDAAGNRAQRVHKRYYKGDREATWENAAADTYIYSYDATGKLVSAKRVNERDTSYASYELTYEYADIYFFDFPEK